MTSINHRARISGKDIVDKTILEVDIGANAVGFNEITTGLQGSLGFPGPDTIGTTQLMEPGVGSENIYNGAVYGTKIADNAVGYGKLTGGLQGSLGVLGPDSVGTTEIKKPGVGSENIETGAVYGAKIAAGAIGTTQIGDNAIGTSSAIDTGVIIARHLSNHVIGSSNLIGTQVITGDNILDHTIGSQHLMTGSVIIQSQWQLKGSIIYNDHVSEHQISVEKLLYPYCYGTITVSKKGVYKEYVFSQMGTTPIVFDNLPSVVLTPIGTIGAVLDHAPDVGSFKAKLTMAGTETVHFIAIGVIHPR